MSARKARPEDILLSSHGGWFGIHAIAQRVMGTADSVAWPAANRAIYIPMYLAHPARVLKVFWANGATVSGNVDMGVYDSAGTRKFSTGSTAQAGTNVLQEVDITDTTLPRGTYYLAMAMDNATGTMFRAPSNVVTLHRALGLAQQANAFALPSSATFAAVDSAYLPICGIALRTLVA